ncbi:MAG TPA: ABC transporter permease, partial [Polyangia bacterium]|nr:ABC transporter permease [Polyangia bacterium]
MRIGDQLRSVRHTFESNKARAALTLLGIMIGAGSIVLLAGLLRGGEEALVRTSQRANEADLIQVRRDEPPQKQLGRTRRDLSEQDAANLADTPLLDGAPVASEMSRESKILRTGHNKRVRLVGAAPIARSLYKLELEKGRFLTDDDLAERRRVCVVGQEIWQQTLESRESLDGVEVSIEGQMWSVVGVLKNKPLLGGGGDGTWMWNRKVLVPHTTFDAMFSPSHDASRVFVRAGATGALADRVRALEGVVRGTLLRRHLGVENFKIEGEDSEANQMRLIIMVIKMLLLGTGLLSLFVGGINIMNIMLVTVTERTREIGVRRAVGATPGAIMMQFLLEASFIAMTGGVIGVLGGMFLSWLTTLVLGHALGEWKLHIETWSIALGLALSLATGIVFGLFPAW